MTATLPATIPGLRRHCSPITANVAGWGKVSGVVRESDGQLWAHVSVEGGGAFLPQRLDAYPFELDLTDPTGFHHALLYLVKHYGLPSVNGLLWRRIRVTGGAYKGWCLENGQGEVRIPNLDVDDPIEALRLAVLAVAGVQG